MSFNVGDSALLFIIKSTFFFPLHLVKHLTNACLAGSEVTVRIPHTGHPLITRTWVLLLSDDVMLTLPMVGPANPPVFRRSSQLNHVNLSYW